MYITYSIVKVVRQLARTIITLFSDDGYSLMVSRYYSGIIPRFIILFMVSFEINVNYGNLCFYMNHFITKKWKYPRRKGL